MKLASYSFRDRGVEDYKGRAHRSLHGLRVRRACGLWLSYLLATVYVSNIWQLLCSTHSRSADVLLEISSDSRDGRCSCYCCSQAPSAQRMGAFYNRRGCQAQENSVVQHGSSIFVKHSWQYGRYMHTLVKVTAGLSKACVSARRAAAKDGRQLDCRPTTSDNKRRNLRPCGV